MPRLLLRPLLSLVLLSFTGCDSGPELDTEFLANTPSTFLATVGGAGTYTGEDGCTITLNAGSGDSIGVLISSGITNAIWTIDDDCTVSDTSASCEVVHGNYLVDLRVWQTPDGLQALAATPPLPSRCSDAAR